ncbi:hypothetical protein TRIP_D250033 [uncultured Paludibacter sp.]|nr:hypothetical protein TRIP_D250033 [uncultured Paludibacter sp.]
MIYNKLYTDFEKNTYITKMLSIYTADFRYKNNKFKLMRLEADVKIKKKLFQIFSNGQ